MENIKIKAIDGLELGCLYSKVDNAKACIQMIHGMVEHKERYIRLINTLNEAGYTVIISDLRGHGESVNTTYKLAHIGKYEDLVADQYEITRFLKQDNPDLDVYMFAHSMGTLVARMYLQKHDSEIKKLLLSGTVCYKPGTGLGVALANWKIFWHSEYGKSSLLYALSNNASFSNDISWISYSEANIKAYTDDYLCGYRFDNLSNKTLFTMVSTLKKYKKFDCSNPYLPILSLSGIDDRTTGGTKGLNGVVAMMEKIGYRNVSFKEYENMRHEILNEENNDIVYQDIVDFYNKEVK